MNTILEKALYYRSLGWSIIPVKVEDIRNGKANKKPLIVWGEFQNRIASEEEIKQWFTTWPNAGIGIITGEVSNIFVLDQDMGGDISKFNLPKTIQSKTGSGGNHYFFKYAKGIKNSSNQLGYKLDIRGTGGFVVAPNSHYSGNIYYEWINSPETTAIAEAPESLLKILINGKTPQNSIENTQILPKAYEKGLIKEGEGRNVAATSYIGYLLEKTDPRIWEEACWPALKLWNLEHCRPSLDENELRTIFNSITQKDLQRRGLVVFESQKNENQEIKKEKIELEEVYKIFDKWLLLKDRNLLKVIVGTIIANRLPMDPVWLFIVAPPGGSKTECIRSLNNVADVYPISNLTAQTFVSGLNRKQDKNIDLLPKITDKTVVFKDFTTILEDNKDVQAAILSQLREIYDGEYNREFGSGKSFHWKGKIGFLAGVTPIIDKHYTVHKSLGERFLQYRILQPDRKEVIKRIEANMRKQTQMREELAEAMTNCVNSIKIPEEVPEISQEIRNKIAEIADLVSRTRSAVIRDEFSRDKEIIFVPGIEMSTRIYAQLYTMALALMVVNGNGIFKNDDFNIIYKLGFDSLHYLKYQILEKLRDYKGWVKTSTLAIITEYSTKTIGKYLEELTVLGAVDRAKPTENLNVWRLKPEIRLAWNSAHLVEKEEYSGFLEDLDADCAMDKNVSQNISQSEELENPSGSELGI